jgi:enamine deaminase RidA (YjgF/YER057c/UK114 family)
MQGIISYSLPSQNDGICLNSVRGGLYSEYFLTSDLTSVNDAAELAGKYQRLVKQLAQHGIIPIHEKVFGYLSYSSLFLNVRSETYRMFGFSPGRIPFSYIEGAPAVKGARWAGVHLYGIRLHDPSRVNLHDVVNEGTCCGKIIDSHDVRQVFLTGLNCESKRNREPVDVKTEIKNLFINLDFSFQNAGFQMSDLVRTWFHLRDIIPSYNEFNDARKDSFNGKVDYNRLPASTAIQGKPAFERGISLDALAIQSRNGNGPVVPTMTSPAQPEAMTYGPLFSRGIEIIWPTYKILLVSGTASIDELGRSVYAENPEQQVSNTLNNISLLLNKYDATMNDIVQATAYFKNPDLEPVFNGLLVQNEWSTMPCLRVVGDVCREDLFFEMDCIAVVQN